MTGEAMKTIYVINGPNLNLLGTRQPEIYGHETLEDIEALCEVTCTAQNAKLVFRQSNHEGELVEVIHEARLHASGIVINPAAYTHTSIAIRDALSACDMPIWPCTHEGGQKRPHFRVVRFELT